MENRKVNDKVNEALINNKNKKNLNMRFLWKNVVSWVVWDATTVITDILNIWVGLIKFGSDVAFSIISLPF